MSELTLKIVTPSGALDKIVCDSIRLNVSDGKDGNGGGSYGIRQGHVRSVLLLSEGKITAYSNGEAIFSAHTGDGFAAVENDTVTVTVESIII